MVISFYLYPFEVELNSEPRIFLSCIVSALAIGWIQKAVLWSHLYCREIQYFEIILFHNAFFLVRFPHTHTQTHTVGRKFMAHSTNTQNPLQNLSVFKPRKMFSWINDAVCS